jgi:hypothetical protein
VPTITLEVPVAGTEIEAGLHATNYSDLQTLLNGGLDNSNISASAVLDATARVGVRKNSAGSVFSRRRINLIEGSGVTLTVADDSGNEEVDVTIASSAGTAGVQVDYVPKTSDTSITATSEGTANTVITGTSQAYLNVAYQVHFFCPQVALGAGGTITIVLLRGATVLGQSVYKYDAGTSDSGIKVEVQDTPAASTFSYVVKAFRTTADGTVKAGAGGAGTLLPAFLRVTRVA